MLHFKNLVETSGFLNVLIKSQRWQIYIFSEVMENLSVKYVISNLVWNALLERKKKRTKCQKD